MSVDSTGNGLLCLALGIAVLAGCNGGESARPAASPQRAADVPPPPPPPPPASLPAAPKATETVQPQNEPAPPAPDMVRVKAEKGVGAKGRGYGTGVIATPAASYWVMRERIAFDQIVHSMNLFKASEGRAPKSHEEFMQRIIKENHIPLPQLPEGERYMYDPKTELLMVLKPGP
jgi:hypothetical protein